jgi:nitrogen-specific signal transduction histidine kinase
MPGMDRNRVRVVNRMPQFLTATQARAQKTVLTMLIPIGSETVGMIPRASSDLANSQTREVDMVGTVVRGRIGFMTEYAAAVHEAPGTLLGKNVPRPNGQGVVWGPSGEPEFLKKGAEQSKKVVEQALRRGMKL